MASNPDVPVETAIAAAAMAGAVRLARNSVKSSVEDTVRPLFGDDVADKVAKARAALHELEDAIMGLV